MKRISSTSIILALQMLAWTLVSDENALRAAEKRQNNLVSVLLGTSEVSQPRSTHSWARSCAGWVFISATCRGTGTLRIGLDQAAGDAILVETVDGDKVAEAMRYVPQGEHQLRAECEGSVRVTQLVIKAIPELMHCGLGFDPAIKSYGKYDLEFLRKDILPNVTTLIMPSNAKLDAALVEDWHRRGKKFVAAVGINYQAKTADEHFQYWTGFWEKAPFLDGIIIDEFIINRPYREWVTNLTPERKRRFDEEAAQYPIYEEAFRKIRADDRYRDKMLYAYIGGSGKKLNQEIVGPSFIHTILDCNYRIGLERYLHEMSSEEKSEEALQEFVDGIADWVAKEPTVREQMVLTFGLFSMPPGGLNKQPNVDYHVWMDQQMHVAANQPMMAGMGGLNWWTSLQADEETVRFVGKLYRHYVIEGKTELFTKDPLFLTHIQNADFEKQLEGWTVQAAEEGSIQTKSFPRYGRIEGRYMGLGTPPDPEYIGDTFLWMKGSAKGPNTVSQTIKNLEPGRLYSLKMFSCDYQDLVQPKKKEQQEANGFLGNITLKGVDVDSQRSIQEMYLSSPEPPIPVWITYHWKVFKALSPTAELVIEDWPAETGNTRAFGQEQTFNFLEIQPYHE